MSERIEKFTEFGKSLTDEQRCALRQLHKDIDHASYHDGCAANAEGQWCCMEALTGDEPVTE
jgi:hypothetical protein